MHKFIPILAAALAMSLPALAQAGGFKSDLATTITGPIKVEVLVSEDMAHRANNLPKKLSDRGSGGRLNAAFSSNGKYGDRALARLVEDLTEELAQDFDEYGISTSDAAPTLLRVTIELAKPNRPTFNQLSSEPSLSFESFGIGGATLSADVIGAGGEILGTMDYDYYSSLNDYPFKPIGVWQDAERTFSRFSKKATKQLAALGAAGTS